jgi:hypothetical protein
VTSSSSPNESEKRLVVEGADGQPTRYYLGGGRITAEGVAWLYERLTGKKMSPEGLEEGRKLLAEASAKLDREGIKSGSSQNKGPPPAGDETE